MLIAVCAASARVGGGAYTPVDPDALVYMDFVGGVYEMDGEAKAVGQLLGGGFNPAAIDAQGMVTPSDLSNTPDATPALLARFQAMLADGFTVLFDLENDASGTDWPLLCATDNADINFCDEALVLTLPNDGGYLMYGDLNFGGGTPAEYLVTGMNKIGYTVNRDLGGGSWRSAHSINGSTATSVDKAFSVTDPAKLPSVGRLRLCHIEDWGQYLNSAWTRKIIFYPAMDEAALEALTG